MRGSDETLDMRRIGLARALSKQGYCSRSQAFDLIRSGHVTLNGRIRRDPEAPVCFGTDRIEVDGRVLAGQEKLYVVLNKPRGVITSAADEQGRKTVYACLKPGLPWLAPVGRLDKASEGLLLFTNDSEWAARVSAPETHLDKTYHVQINCLGDQTLIDKITGGITTLNGERLSAKRARILRHGEKNTWLEVILDEGKNRQIRRILTALGLEVLRLVRVAVGPLVLGELPKGTSRLLTTAEKRNLDRAVQATTLS
ncbi:MAG TPA: pseudouridine synthase [Terriglobales bacterium]|nr:pseudouridine synthase [Terriglobales bacterium]